MLVKQNIDSCNYLYRPKALLSFYRQDWHEVRASFPHFQPSFEVYLEVSAELIVFLHDKSSCSLSLQAHSVTGDDYNAVLLIQKHTEVLWFPRHIPLQYVLDTTFLNVYCGSKMFLDTDHSTTMVFLSHTHTYLHRAHNVQDVNTTIQ